LKKKQYISLLFLFAISLVLAHSIIPHHHDEPYLFSCHPVTDKQDNPEKTPWYCHALSQVVFIEYQLLNKYKIVKPFQFNFIQVQVQQQLPTPETEQDKVLYTDVPLLQFSLISPSHLRAPPIFA